MTAYDRDNPEHPRIRDVWGHVYRNRAVRVVIVGTSPGSPSVTIRYVTSQNRRDIDLGELLDGWRLLSRWPGLDPEEPRLRSAVACWCSSSTHR